MLFTRTLHPAGSVTGISQQFIQSLNTLIGANLFLIGGPTVNLININLWPPETVHHHSNRAIGLEFSSSGSGPKLTCKRFPICKQAVYENAWELLMICIMFLRGQEG